MESSTEDHTKESQISTHDIELQGIRKEPLNDVEEGDEVYILGEKSQQQWVRYARLVSYVSIAFTLVGGITGIFLSFLTDSVSLLGYGLESFVDVWSSVLVLWRFWNDADMDESNTKHTAFNKREQRASCGIAVTFVLIGLFVGVQACLHLAIEEKPSNGNFTCFDPDKSFALWCWCVADALLCISAISAVLLSVLAAVKFRISRELDSPALYKDGMSSAAVAILSFGILLSAAIYDAYSKVWWLDNVVALLIAMFLIIYGTVSIFKQKK